MEQKSSQLHRTSQPVEYLRTFLEKDVRPDGRELGEFRNTTINLGAVGTAEGSAIVTIGHTTVICGIKAELTIPSIENPDKGIIVPNVEMNPMCSQSIKPGAPSIVAQAASQFILKVIHSSKCIKAEDLCITKHNLCWVIYCDIQCLDWDGNLLDACLLSCIAALKNTQLPVVTWNEETSCPVTDPQTKLPLPVYSLPIATSVSIFDDEVLLVDSTHDEELVATGSITVVTMNGDICLLHKPGGSAISDEQIDLIIGRSLEREGEINKLLNQTLMETET